MTRLAFIDTACPTCGGEVTGRGATYCSKSCASKARPPRYGADNANWRGGTTSHPLYDSYHQMVARCTDPTHPRWEDYGGRGITVCQRWLDDYWAFVEDLGARPAGHVMDRIDNDGSYEPGNVRWVTIADSNRNRRTSGWENRQRDAAGRWA